MPTFAKLPLFFTAGLLALACTKKDAQPPANPPPPPPMPAMGSLPAPEPTLNEFDEVMGDMILKRGARKAQQCATAGEKPPKGKGSVDVVFDGNKGRIVDVKITDTFGGASDDGLNCIRNAFVGEIVPPFKGGSKVVPYTLELPGG